ncbi:MAG TPA: MFS transporter [Polyangia bacterium]|nr:MFS transporter [Polyangia bacterium]
MSQPRPTTPLRAEPIILTAVPMDRSGRARALGWLGLPTVYWFLWAGVLLNRLGGSVFCLLAVYLTGRRDLSPAEAGWVISLFAAGGMMAGPIGGVLADRVGRRATLLAGTAGAGVLMLALGGARTTGGIVLLAPLLGFFTDVTRPAMQAAVADLVPAVQRVRAYGLLYWAVNLGYAGSAALGGVLAARSFTSLFVIDALTTVAYGLIVYLRVPETRPAVTARAVPVPYPASASTSTSFLAPFRDGAMLTLLAIQLPVFLAFTQMLAALPLDMRAHGIPTDRVGVLLGINGVVIVVGQPLAVRPLERLPHAIRLAIGAALTGVGLGAVALAAGPCSYAAAIALFTCGEIAFSTGGPALIAELAPADRRGAYQGAYHLAWGLASMAAPPAGAFALAHAGSRALWLGCLAVSLIAAILHLRVTARRLRHRRATS